MQERVKKNDNIVTFSNFKTFKTNATLHTHSTHPRRHTIHKQTLLVSSNNICKHVMRETVMFTGFHIWTANHGLHVVNHLVA